MAYELAFILNPLLEKSDADAAAEKVRDFVNQAGGAVKNLTVQEKKKLSYAIKKQLFGYFTVIEFELEADKTEELQKKLALDKDVLRSLIINLNELRTQKPGGKPRKPKPVPSAQAISGETPAQKPEKTEKVKIEELDKKLEELLKE